MPWHTRKDGRHFQSSKSLTENSPWPKRLVTKQRKISRQQKAHLQSLENPLLYANFKKKLERLNPDVDIDSIIDRTLEPEEAIGEIKRHNPEINIGLNNHEGTDFREWLDEMGIEDHKFQNLVAM